MRIFRDHPEQLEMTLSTKTLDAIISTLTTLYGKDASEEICDRMLVICRSHKLNRPRTPAVRDTLWDESDTFLITYGDSIADGSETAPLATLKRFCDQHLQDAISTIHLLPFFPYSSDDGFSVIHYRKVNSDLGSWQDIRDLNTTFELMFDFVLNHISRESLWFADYLENMPPGNRYFIETDPEDTRIKQVVRPRAEPLSVRIRTRHDERHVWATFSKDQIDLNYKNPDVLLQALDTLLYYIREGARVVRLDAVAFLWKELGTCCIHLPQTHLIIQLLRTILDDIAPDVILLTETNVPHKENISYFGEGNEAHMVYQFSLPPLLLHAIVSGSTQYLTSWLSALEAAPAGCTFLNFTASHDGVGVRALEGLVPDSEVESLMDAMRARGGYISTRAQADGTEAPYELNISYFDAMRLPDQHDSWQASRFVLSQTLAFSLQGVPAVYIHSLLATPNDHEGVERTGRTRSINRRKLDLQEIDTAFDNIFGIERLIFDTLRNRLIIRRRQKAFHPEASQEVMPLGNELLGIKRVSQDGEQTIYAIYNFTQAKLPVEFASLGLNDSEDRKLVDLISGKAPKVDPDNTESMQIPPYGCLWLQPMT